MILNCRFRSEGWWPRPPCPCQHHQPFAEDMHIGSKSTISHFHWWVATNLCWKIQPCGSSCARQGYVRKFWCESRNPWYTGTGSRTIEHIAQKTIREIETRKYVCIESLWRALLCEWEGVVSMHTGHEATKACTLRLAPAWYFQAAARRFGARCWSAKKAAIESSDGSTS